MLKISQVIREDVYEFINIIKDLIDGKSDDTAFKGRRAVFGIYEERNGGGYMLRPRITGAVVSIEEFEFYNELAREYSNGRIHFTTRQDIQFHGVRLEKLPELLERLFKKGIISSATGGNAARAVALPPLTGFEKNEVFDVMPHVFKITEYLLNDRTNFTLPRKYKIAVGNSNENGTYPKISDLGLIAVSKDGKRGFKVYGGGGLGAVSRPSILLKEFIEEDEILYHVQAMKELFEALGDRQNRAKARIRHIVTRIGEENFRTEYDKFLEKVKKDNKIENLKYFYSATQELEAGEKIEADGINVIELKKEGRYALYVHPVNGNIYYDETKEIIDSLKKARDNVEIRLTSNQSFYIAGINGKNVGIILEVIRKISTKEEIGHSIACTGAATCKLGILRPQDMLKVIIERFNKENEEVRKGLPKIYFSGCPNSCGQHHIGEIGFYGRFRKNGEHLYPVYTLMTGSNTDGETAVLAKESGEIPAKNIPEFLVELAKLKIESGELKLSKYIEKNGEKIKKIVEKYGKVPSYEEESGFYKDYGIE